MEVRWTTPGKRVITAQTRSAANRGPVRTRGFRSLHPRGPGDVTPSRRPWACQRERKKPALSLQNASDRRRLMATTPSTGRAAGGPNPRAQPNPGKRFLRTLMADGLPDVWEKLATASISETPAGVNGASGDPDGDGMNNLQEYFKWHETRADATSYLKIESIDADARDGPRIRFNGRGRQNLHSFSIGTTPDNGPWLETGARFRRRPRPVKWRFRIRAPARARTRFFIAWSTPGKQANPKQAAATLRSLPAVFPSDRRGTRMKNRYQRDIPALNDPSDFSRRLTPKTCFWCALCARDLAARQHSPGRGRRRLRRCFSETGFEGTIGDGTAWPRAARAGSLAQPREDVPGESSLGKNPKGR